MSIESQKSELRRLFSALPGVEIVEWYTESKSAKSPGRPIFDGLISRIERGEASGIVAWAPDRLARNSIDGGRLIYLLDTGKLTDLKFATYTFENNSQGKFMLQIMFGQSKYYSDALSENVKRGNRTKIENGWRPNKPPLGYLNDKSTKTIVNDPDRFLVVRRMWDLMLSEGYQPRRIWQMSIYNWGLRTVQLRRIGGKPLALSAIYKIFTNPFYAGILVWHGEMHPGKHEPMVTLDEFDRVQAILGRPGKPQPQKRVFAFTGLIRCGACGLVVTAEVKIKPSGRRYTYYHCTRRLVPRCAERSLDLKGLEQQMLTFLEKIAMPTTLHNWAVGELDATQEERKALQHLQIQSLENELLGAERSTQALIDLRIRSLIDDAELVSKRQELQHEILRLRQNIDRQKKDAKSQFEPAQAVFSFSNRAISWFAQGDDEAKRLVAEIVGSNFTLKDKILNIEARKPFHCISKNSTFPQLRAVVENIRTIADEPEFKKVVEKIQYLEKKMDGRQLAKAA